MTVNYGGEEVKVREAPLPSTNTCHHTFAREHPSLKPL